MATWNPIRTPSFKMEQGPSKQPVMDSPLSRLPLLKPILVIKSLLKGKRVTDPVSNSASRRHCGAQISDLTRRAYNRVSSNASGSRSFGSLRRTRSERKKDWDEAMDSLLEVSSVQRYERVDRALNAFQLTVLARILLAEHTRLKLSITDLPMMILISPPNKTSVLDVESNMCFEIEYLKSMVERPLLHDKDRPNVESFFTVVIANLELCASKKLIDTSCRDTIVDVPIVKSTEIERSCYFRRRHLNHSPLVLLRKPFSSKVIAQLLKKALNTSKLDTNSTDLDRMEKYRVPIMEYIKRTMRSSANYSEIATSSLKSCPPDLVEVDVIKRDNVALSSPSPSPKDIGRPIMRRTILTSDSVNGKEHLKWKDFIPKARAVCTSVNAFMSLVQFQRFLFTSEKSIWGRPSKEVMSRGRYKRKRLLSSYPSIASLALSSGQYSTRLKSTSNFGSNATEVLDSAVFLRLKALLVHYQQTKSGVDSLLRRLTCDAEHLQKNRQNSRSLRFPTVMKMLFQYDPPIRKWSQVHFANISPRYEHPSAEVGHAGELAVSKRRPMEQEVDDSDESVLDDFILSGEELEGPNFGDDGLGALVEIERNVRQHANRNKEVQHLRKGEDAHKEKYGLQNLKGDTRKKLKVRLQVPEALVCAPWVIRAAEQCIKTMPKGSIFVPPPLSALPVVAVVVSTYLRDSLRDQRVAIVCESETNVSHYIRDYLRSSLGDSISIDSIRRSEHHSVESCVLLPDTAARVVILDSFCFSFSITFSLLVVLVTGDGGVSVESTHLQDQVFNSRSSLWGCIPFIILAPLDTPTGLQPQVKTIRRLSKVFSIHNVLYVTAKDDVHDTILISDPRILHLVPSQQALQLAKLMDAQAAPFLQTYNSVRTRDVRTSKSTSTLRDIHLQFLEEKMQETVDDEIAGRTQRLEILYNLRQARTYAIYDGFNIAVAYLEHCSDKSNGLVRHVVDKVLENVESQRNDITPDTHPVLKPLMKCVLDAEEKMLQDPPSLHSVHRRDRFHPLIVGNSQEAISGCFHGFENAVPIEEAKYGSIAICSLHDLRIKSRKTRNVSERLEEFSHVFHIVNDRYNIQSDLLLPPILQQHVHAGRTRLITIAVDETQELDDRWKQDFAQYEELSRRLVKEEFGEVVCGASYMQQMSVESLLLAVKDAFPGWEDSKEKLVETSTPDKYMKTLGQKAEAEHSRGALHLTSSDICAATVKELREILRKHLEALPRESPVLHVFVYIEPHESCTPTTTVIHSALAADERLHQRVVINTTFLF